MTYGIFTTFITNIYDEHHKKSISKTQFNYVENWVLSFQNLTKEKKGNYIGGIITNTEYLPWPQIKTLNYSEAIKKYEEYSIYDFRFLLYKKVILEHPNIDFFFFTDGRDVTIQNFSEKEIINFEKTEKEKNNEFNLQNILFVNEESGIKWDYKIILDSDKNRDNDWIQTMANHTYYHNEFDICQNEKTLNCGIIGGHRSVLLEFLNYFEKEFFEINPTKKYFENKKTYTYCIDMALLNKIVYEKFKHNFYSGFPLQNVYWANDKNPFSWFHHK